MGVLDPDRIRSLERREMLASLNEGLSSLPRYCQLRSRDWKLTEIQEDVREEALEESGNNNDEKEKENGRLLDHLFQDHKHRAEKSKEVKIQQLTTIYLSETSTSMIHKNGAKHARRS